MPLTSPIPNFFIVGAPKCGTTALAAYLGEHPDIFMSDPKEPHFFADDLPGRHQVHTLHDYLALFADGAGRRVIGEASVHYLFSETAIANIRRFNPDARLVAMLRNPLEMVPALHGEFLHGLHEDAPSFERAWQLQARRAQGECLPPYGKDPALLQYRQVARYAAQLRRLLQHFPREQLKVILFDDFKRDTREVYEDVLAFLDLPSDGRSTFARINPSHAFRLRRLGVLITRKPPWLRRSWAVFKRLFGVDAQAAKAVGDWIYQKNSVSKPRPALSPGMQVTLAATYADDIAELAALIGRDLSHWLRPDPGGK